MHGGGQRLLEIDYKNRLSKLQKQLKKEGWSGYVATRQATTSWLLGIFVPWRTGIIIPAEGDPVALLWRLDATRVTEESHWSYESRIWGENDSFSEAVAAVLTEKGLDSEKVAVDIGSPITQQLAPGLMIASEMLSLQQLLPLVKWVNAVPMIEELLAIKDEAEIQRLRKAATIADYGMEQAGLALEPGVTENYIAGVVEKAIREKGSEWSWSTTLGTEVGSGLRTGFLKGVTQPATEKILQKDELVIVDLHPMYQLYLSDLAGNFYLGEKPPKQIANIADCWESTVEILLKSIKPGAVIDDIVNKGFSNIKKKGFEQYSVKAFGHGLGTCARVEPYIVENNQAQFKENMVIALGTHVYVPKIGGMRLELPVLVTKSGAEPLSKWPSKLHLKY